MPVRANSFSGVNQTTPLLQPGEIQPLRRNSEIIRQNPLNGDPLPAPVAEARQRGQLEIQNKTNGFKAFGVGLGAAVYGLGKLTAKIASLPFKAVNMILFNLPSKGINAGVNWMRGLKSVDQANFQVNVPGMGELELDGHVLPTLMPRGSSVEDLRAEVQQKINAGHELLQNIRNDAHDAPATKEDVSNITFFLQAKGQMISGQTFQSGAFSLPDPDCKIRKFLDSSPQAYQRASSHLGAFQKLEGGRHRGIDLTEGGNRSLSEAMPFGKETLLYGSMPQNEGLKMPEDRIFLKLESCGAWLSKPSAGYEANNAGPRRTGQWHDIGTFVDHSCNFLKSRGKGSAAGTQKERIPKDIKKDFKDICKINTDLAERMNQGNPTNKSNGIRFMYANAKAELQRMNEEMGFADADEALIGQDRHSLDFMELKLNYMELKNFVNKLENRYNNLNVRIGNEVIFDN